MKRVVDCRLAALIVGSMRRVRTAQAKPRGVENTEDSLPKPFYNADSIAEGLGDANDAHLQREARQLVDQRIRNNINSRTTFGFESTYSGRSRPNIVRAAKHAGYTTRAIFLGTENAEINITRVRKRVSEGGHHVNNVEVRRRWTRAWKNLLETWNEFDTVRILDNSGRKPIEIARKNGSQVTRLTTTPDWAQKVPKGPNPTATPARSYDWPL